MWNAAGKTLKVDSKATVASLVLEKSATVTVEKGASFETPVVVKANSIIIAKEEVPAVIKENVKVTVKTDENDKGTVITGTESTEAVDVKEEAAKEAVAIYEGKVDSADKIVALVTNKDLATEVSDLYTPTANKINVIAEGDLKVQLLARLDAAHSKAIAAGTVNALQNATKDLTVENLDNAKIKLSNAKTNVKNLKDEEIKTALNELITAEETKIKDLEKEIATKAADDQAVKDFAALDTTYATKADAETAIKAVATNNTLDETTISWDGMVATVTLNTGTVDLTFTGITEVKDAIQKLTTQLTKSTKHTFSDTPANGNYKELSGLSVSEKTVTADISGDSQAITNIFKKPGIHTALGKVGEAKATFDEVTAYYINNTIARYLGALERSEGSTVKTIVYSNDDYTVNGGSLKGSNWKDASYATLVSKIASNLTQDKSDKTINLTLKDANDYSIEITLKITGIESVEEVTD